MSFKTFKRLEETFIYCNFLSTLYEEVYTSSIFLSIQAQDFIQRRKFKIMSKKIEENG